MENFTEHYKTKKTLFSSVSKILDKHGLYSIEYLGYSLNYWFNKDNVYKVIKGRNDSSFEFMNMPYEVDDHIEIVYLKKGDVLIYETEYEDQTWFTCTSMLKGKKEMQSDCANGFTEYGSLSAMLNEGLIEKVLIL